MTKVKDLGYAALLAVYGKILTERQREMAELYYWDDLSLAEIAENLGITRQAVRDGIKHSEQRLRKLDEKLGLLEKVRQCEKQFDRIARLAGECTDPADAVGKIEALANDGKEIF